MSGADAVAGSGAKDATVSSTGLRPPRQRWASRHRSRLLPVATVLMIILVWEVLGRTLHWNPLFFSYPSQIWSGGIDLARGPLWENLRISGIEFVLGMAISVGIAVPVGLLMGTVRNLYYALDPIVSAMYSTPVLVLAPLLVIWFGLGIASKVAIVVILSTFPVMINLTEGVRTTDQSLVRAARSFGASRLNIYRDVVFPSVVPFFVTGLRLAVGRALIGVVVGEYIASQAGIGYQINADAEIFATDRYLAGVAVIVVFSVIVIELLKVLERRLAPWRHVGHDQP